MLHAGVITLTLPPERSSDLRMRRLHSAFFSGSVLPQMMLFGTGTTTLLKPSQRAASLQVPTSFCNELNLASTMGPPPLSIEGIGVWLGSGAEEQGKVSSWSG